MGMEAVPQQFAQDAPHAGQAQPTGGDVLPKSAIMLYPAGTTLPPGWQTPWIKAGWVVSACPNPGCLPAVVRGAGRPAAAVPALAERRETDAGKSAVRAHAGLGGSSAAASDVDAQSGGLAGSMLRRSDFLAQLSSLRESESRVSVLMAIQLDQAATLDARLDRTAVFALEESMSTRIAAVLEAGDTVTLWLEYGFGVLVQRKTAAEVSDVAARICTSIAAEPFLVGDEALDLSVSIGLALAPSAPCADRAQEWFSTAYAAQGIASRHGGNRPEGVLTREFEPMPAERVLIIREWVADARAGRNVIVEFQPLLPASTQAGELYSVHAKLRDARAPLGGVYRREYLRLARAAGAMIMINRISLFQAFETLEQECRAGRSTRLVVPVELDTLHGMAWRWLVEELRRRPQLRDRLIVELEASRELTEKENLMCIVRLRRFGVRVSLSDQCGDLAQLALWTKFPVDFLRIPYATVAENTDAEFTAATRGFKESGRQLIVDSVSDTGAVSRLAALGIDYLRGRKLAATGARLDYDFSAAF